MTRFKKERFIKYMFSLLLYSVFKKYQIAKRTYQISRNRSIAAKCRRKKETIPWSIVNKRISDTQFRRMFRMTRHCFSELCNLIISRVGESKLNLNLILMSFFVIKITCTWLILAHQEGIFQVK